MEEVAGAIRKVYDKIKEIRAANPQPRETFGAKVLSEKSAISAEPLNKIIGAKGEENNGMVKFTIGRSRHREERSAFELVDGLSLREPL